MQCFKSRELTCDSLRLNDVNKIVTLVGWLDMRKSTEHFLHLCDGYGLTQIVLKNINLQTVAKIAKETDIILVKGIVMARPKAQWAKVRQYKKRLFRFFF